MAIEFRFQIDPARIVVQDAQTGYQLEVSNRVIYRRRDGQILLLGVSEQEAQSRLSNDYEREVGEICSALLFGAEGGELANELRAMENFTRLLHHQSQRARPTAHFLTKLVDGFDYIVSLPGYEAYPESRRQRLEQRLQGHLRLRRLVINGREVQTPLWRRNLEFWLRRMLLWVIPIAAMVVAYLTMPAIIASKALFFLLYLLAIIYLCHYAGKVLWMLLARRLVPLEYRLCMLQGVRSRLSPIDRYLAKVWWRADLARLHHPGI